MASKIVPTTFTGPSGREYTMYGPKGDHQVNHWRAGHFYEGNAGGILKWAWENPRYFERVVDIGASLGNHSVFFAGELGSEVIAIEPHTPEIAEWGVAANGLSDRVDVHEALIGWQRHYKMISPPPGNIGMASYEPCGEAEADCRGQYLEDVICDYWPTAIKIDAEAMGIEVLVSSEYTIGIANPAIIMETNRVETADRLLPRHTRIPQVFNSTPTHVWIPS